MDAPQASKQPIAQSRRQPGGPEAPPDGVFTIVVALEGQLRLDDQPCFHEAVALARRQPGSRLLVLASRPEGQRLRGPHQRRIAAQALACLRSRLSAVGIPVVVCPQQTSAAALAELRPLLRVDRLLQAQESRLFGDWPLPPGRFPLVFSDFRRGLERAPEPALPPPDLSGLGWTESDWPPAWPLEWLRPATAGPSAEGGGADPGGGDPGGLVPSDLLAQGQGVWPTLPKSHLEIDPCTDHPIAGLAQPSIDSPIDSSIDPQSDPRSAFPFRGDEPTALARLQHFCFGSDGLTHYKARRNGLVGTEFSSKLSPFLAIGSLSVRRIWQEILRYQALHGADEGSEWLKQELLWREFFLWSEQRHGAAFHAATGLQNRQPDWIEDRQRFARWCRADAGHPLIDAQLRELLASGYLSNRGRQWVASHFINDLQLPWIWGARFFEWWLIDAQPALNTGNWAYLAGVGSDPRSFGGSPRRFDLERQVRLYDPGETHRQRWS